MIVQSRVAHPMMPLDLFQARGFRLALPVGFAFMVGNYGNVFVVSLFLQQQLRLSPLQAGLVFLPSAFFAIAANLASGPITNRYGARAARRRRTVVDGGRARRRCWSPPRSAMPG